MKSKTHLRTLAIILSVLIISIPICFAEQLNLIYDANGNLVSGDGKYREYNSLNQLSKIYNGSDTGGTLLEEYEHHPVEERIWFKKVYHKNGSIKETVYYVSKNYVRVVNSSGTYDFTYIYHEGQLVAQLNPDGSKYFIHTDHLGSTSVVTDENANVIENTTYSPFGFITDGGEQSRYDYEGKEFDSVIGSYDFHFRQFGVSVKDGFGAPIWQQPDTLIQNVYDPQSLNRYMFERGNPYKNVDPTGHIIPFIAIAAQLLVAATIGATTGAIGGAAVEASIQLIFAREVYSSERVIDATKEGAIMGGSMGLLGPGSNIPVLGLIAKTIGGSKTILNIPSSIQSAKEYKKSKEILEREKEENKLSLKIEKGIYIDESGKEIPIIVPTGTEKISVYKGGSCKGYAVPLYKKEDGTVVWGRVDAEIPKGVKPISQKKNK